MNPFTSPMKYPWVSMEKESWHNRRMNQIFIVTSVFLSLFCIVSSKPLVEPAPAEADYQALLHLKDAFIDYGGALSNWNGTQQEACSGVWVGIKCVHGRVVAIQLPGKLLGGHITDKIGALTALKKLSLHDNFIGGSIPSALASLPNLRGLYLSNNRLSGSIPSSIGDSGMLVRLDLSHNLLNGSIPASLSNCAGLRKLNLSHNKLSGTIPVGLTRSPFLSFLFLQHNLLSGSIPDTWGGTEDNATYSLQYLNLGHNFFSGGIPVTFSKLRMLRGLSLSSNMLNGSIPDELGTLWMLRRLDLSGNSIGGSFPTSLCNIFSLDHLNLGSNRITGKIPKAIDGLHGLFILSLKSNKFYGEIPATLGNMSLQLLDLSENDFDGEIPTSLEDLTELTSFNVSNNDLSGQVPLALSQRFNASSFEGNVRLCGYSSSPCPSSPPYLPPKHSDSRPKKIGIILIAVCAAAIALLLLLCCPFLFHFFIRRSTMSNENTGSSPATEGNEQEEAFHEDAAGFFVHFGGPSEFTADELLCAKSERMARGTYGTVYRAILDDGTDVIVKRLKGEVVQKGTAFETEINALGKIRHPNLMALRAYYLGLQNEALLILDYMPKGSLAAILREQGRCTRLDWRTRMNIAIGVARGLCYLHTELNMAHGRLTSDNVLLDENADAKIADYGISNLILPSAKTDIGSTGYHAPELLRLEMADMKSDVYSLGVIMLELLTSKSAAKVVSGMELTRWVATTVNEQWSGDVFDIELVRETAGGGEDELFETLKLALSCVDSSAEARPSVKQVLQKLEEIRPELASPAQSPAVDEGGGSARVSTSSS